MEGIKVFVRVRPLSINSESSYQRNGEGSVTGVSKCNKEISINTTSRQVRCRYDHVFGPSSTQEEVYKYVRSSVNSVLKGINSTIFAYGQTSSGKTHTMFGRESCIFKEPGIVPRCIHDIFQFTSTSQQIQSFSVYVSFIQVYNEQIYDMLDDPERTKPLSIHETPHLSNITISGLTEYQVHSYKQCLSIIELGLSNRAIRETNMNYASSRSHSILQITIEQSRINQMKGTSSSMCSKLNLVDLAGSERWMANGARGKEMGDGQISELTNINSSLYTLGRCIAALAKRSQMDKSALESSSHKHIHVPFRDSKLTRMLQDSLGGNSKTYLVATINPSLACSDESVSTLRFADRAHQVMTFAQVNEEIRQDNSEVRALRQEILRLQQLLQINGIQHSLSSTSNSEISNTYRLSFGNDDDDNYDKMESSIQIQNNAINELKNMNALTNDTMSQEDDSDTDRQDGNSPSRNSSEIAKVKNSSAVHLQRITCEKIVNALGTVLVAVDSFLKSLNPSSAVTGVEGLSEPSILEKRVYCDNDNAVKKDGEDRWNLSYKSGLSIHSDTKRSNGMAVNKTQFKNTAKGTETLTVPTSQKHNIRSSKSKSLSSLLKQRRKLHGEEKDDLKLEEELKKARKNKDQKLQLRQWLLEKETKAENPKGSFYLT